MRDSNEEKMHKMVVGKGLSLLVASGRVKEFDKISTTTWEILNLASFDESSAVKMTKQNSFSVSTATT